MTKDAKNGPYLTGQLLIAMPTMPDIRFARSVVYLCAHSEEGAMGLVVNQAFDAIDFPGLLKQLGIETEDSDHAKNHVQDQAIRVQFGGPVEQGRGFVLHSADYVQESTMVVDDQVALTATVDILQSIATGKGPSKRLLALGYAGWGPGQLDDEILKNGWLTVESDPALLFNTDLDGKWEKALDKIGIRPEMLSDTAGHA